MAINALTHNPKTEIWYNLLQTYFKISVVTYKDSQQIKTCNKLVLVQDRYLFQNIKSCHKICVYIEGHSIKFFQTYHKISAEMGVKDKSKFTAKLEPIHYRNLNV